jgi:hypothetical protein
MLPPFIVIPDFHPEAAALRAAFDAHFADPVRHVPEIHQVWNYWSVPGHYTYLRTQPEKIIPRPLCDGLFTALARVAFERFGMSVVTWPFLSLYVSGCSQNIHNDARNGRLGFVYSLTNWDQRRFAGGETMIFRDRPFVGGDTVTEPRAATDFYDLVPPLFNQLLIFDDRVPHAVPRIEGTMEPHEGRVVLHGHFAEGPAVAVGALPMAVARAAVTALIGSVRPRLAEIGKGLAGTLNLRVSVRGDGTVEGGQILYDRLLPVAEGAVPAKDAIGAAIAMLRDVRFPAANGATMITFALPFGPPLAREGSG